MRSFSFRVAVAVSLIPIAVMVARFFLDTPGDLLATGDVALTELRVRSITKWPLVGPYSRWDVFHPGPALLYLLALGYWWSGGASVSIEFAAAMLNGCAVVALLALARRIDGARLVWWTVAAIGALFAGSGVERVLSPWNPSTNVLAILVTAYACWLLALGRPMALPAVVASGSVTVQSHYGTALIVALAGVVSAGLCTRRCSDFAMLRRPLALAATVAMVLWLPVALHEVTEGPQHPNLAALVQLNSRADMRPLGVRDGSAVAGPHLGVFPTWALTRMGPGIKDAYGAPGDGLASVPWIVVVLAAVAWWRRDRPVVVAGAAIALSLVVGAVVSLWQVRGGVLPWLTWFLAPIAAMGWIVIVSAYRRRPLLPVLAAGLATSVALVSAVAVDVGSLRSAVGIDSDPEVAKTGASIAARVQAEAVVLDAAPQDWGDEVAVTALALSRRGVDVGVSARLAHPLGPELYAESGRDRRCLLLQKASSPRRLPRARLVVSAGGYAAFDLERCPAA